MNTKPISASQPVKETNNMKKLKTFLCSALTVVSLFSLTACGDAKAPEKQPAFETTSEPTVAVQDETQVTIPDNKIAINPFDYLEIRFEGTSPDVIIRTPQSFALDGHIIDFHVKDQSRHYKNGDTVTIVARISEKNYYESKYIATETEKDFIVKTDEWLVESADEISKENMTAMQNKAKTIIENTIAMWARNADETFESYELVKTEFWMITPEYTSERPNRLIFYYKINIITEDGEPTAQYSYVSFANIIENVDGKQTVDLENYRIADAYPSDEFVTLEGLRYILIGDITDDFIITNVNFE